MEIITEVVNRVGFITLNRPAVLNALSYTMVTELDAQLRTWAQDPAINAVSLQGAGEKAFCAGGDIRALRDSYLRSDRLHHEFFVAEYRLDYLLHRYPKPLVAVLDGITMGGGMGLAQGAHLRIVGDRTRMAMPEVGIGFIPDVGATYFLSRLPHAIGVYLALTGAGIRAADAIYAGLADCYLGEHAIAELPSALNQIEWSAQPRNDIERCVRALASTTATPPLRPFAAAIEQHFSKPDVQSILNSLQHESRADHHQWAQQTLNTIGSRSPLELAVTVRQLQLGKQLSLADCFRLELGMVRHGFAHGNIIEGVRALIVDKDNQPKWNPARLEDISPAMVEDYLRSPWSAAAHPLSDLEP